MAFDAKWAVLAGSGQYKNIEPLKYCSKDVHELRRALIDHLEFGEDHICALSDKSENTMSRAEIFDTLGHFSSLAKPNDLLVFYFSGHGILSDGKDYLLPPEASVHAITQTGIKVDDLTALLKKSLCHNIVLFIDACREQIAGTKGIVFFGEDAKLSLQKAGIITFFSCDPRDRSYEIDDISHSSFTYALLEAIKEGKYITVNEISDFLRIRVPAINNKYNKPQQQPFVVAEPIEKGGLPLFTSSRRRSDVAEIDALIEGLGNMYTFEQYLDDESFSEAVEVLYKAAKGNIGEPDEIKIKLIKRVYKRSLTGPAFAVALKAVRKRFHSEPIAS